MKGLNKISKGIDVAVNWICIILMALMTAIVLLQVSTRLLPMKNPNWTEELSRYIMIYIAYIGASMSIREWTNVGVDFVIERFPKSIKFLLNVLIRLAVLAFWVFAIYISISVFPKTGMRQKSASMGFPIFYAQCSLIIGSILCSIQGVIQLLNYMTGGKDK